MTRRQFATAAAIGTITSRNDVAYDARTADQSPPAYDGNQKVEHYVLLGSRMVFTNWYFVRPGNFTWLDKDGQDVFTSSKMIGPWGARFKGNALPHGVRLAAQPAERVGPVIQPEQACEQSGISLDTLIKDEGLFRAWGQSFSPGGKSVQAYFESDDGFKWRRPNLGIREWNGSVANNLLKDPIGTVFVDPAASAHEKYKWVRHRHYSKTTFDTYLKSRPGPFDPMIEDNSDPDSFHAAEGATSPDGFHWTILRSPLVFEPTDTQLVCYYDLRRRKYVLYTRAYMGAGLSARRAIGRAESDDFHSFPVSRVIFETSPEMSPTDTLYTNCRTTIPNAPDHHLMFPAIYDLAVDSTKIGFASSHDGESWSFVPGSPVAQPGRFGEWDGGVIFAHPSLLELPDGCFALPYTGYSFPHKYPRGEWKLGTGYLS